MMTSAKDWHEQACSALATLPAKRYGHFLVRQSRGHGGRASLMMPTLEHLVYVSTVCAGASNLQHNCALVTYLGRYLGREVAARPTSSLALHEHPHTRHMQTVHVCLHHRGTCSDQTSIPCAWLQSMGYLLYIQAS